MLLAEVANYLVAQGVGPTGSTADYSIGIGYEPPSPDRFIALVETGGLPNEGLSTGTVDRATFQVRVRGPSWGTLAAGSYTTARAKIETVRSTLEGVLNKTIGNPAWRYLHIKSFAPPLDQGRDVNDRPNLTMNFWAYRSRTS